MCIWAALIEFSKLKKKKEYVCLGGKSGEGIERVRAEEVRGRFAQNTLYTCMKFYT